MVTPPGKKRAGVCLLCGSDLWVERHVTRAEDAPAVFLRGTNIHDCEAGRILHEHGSDVYQMWLSAQASGSRVSVEELFAELEQFEAECGR
jgi:hypothetical protein